VTIGDSFSTILAPPLRNRKFVDSLLERNGFEFPVPRETQQISNFGRFIYVPEIGRILP